MVKSWNEWAEGNYLEPDLKYGHEYLQALKNAVTSGCEGNVQVKCDGKIMK